MRGTGGSGVARCAEIERSACDRQRRAIFERSARSSAGTGREARARGVAGGPNTHLRPIPSRHASTHPSGGRRRLASTWWRAQPRSAICPNIVGTRGLFSLSCAPRARCTPRVSLVTPAKKQLDSRLTTTACPIASPERARGGRRGSAARPGCPARHAKRCARAERACFPHRSPFRHIPRATTRGLPRFRQPRR